MSMDMKCFIYTTLFCILLLSMLLIMIWLSDEQQIKKEVYNMQGELLSIREYTHNSIKQKVTGTVVISVICLICPISHLWFLIKDR